MTFLISIETQSRGSYVLGFLEVEDKVGRKNGQKIAQQAVVENLVSVGFPKEKIGIQVTDNTSLEIGNHRVLIIPIQEFDNKSASYLAGLLKR